MPNRLSLPKAGTLLTCLVLMMSSLPSQPVHAAQLSSRSVRISSSVPSAQTQYRFNFTLLSSATLGSIELEVCDNSPLVGTACTPPSGFSFSSATLGAQSGETGFSIHPSSTANKIILSRPPGLSSAIAVSYTLNNVTNPSAVKTSYARLATYGSTDATGPRTDDGGVAFATTRSFQVASYVPPYLTFCVGVTITSDCSSTTGDFLNFGELSSKQAKFLSSQFGVATNDFTGYSTTVSGVTMTSGNNTIPALDTPTPSQAGTSQFGMNLRANSDPPVGANPTGVGSGIIAPDFAQTNNFAYKNEVVVTSVLPSDFNVFTVSYVVNVAASQKPGVYSTTLTYIATASF